MIIETKILATLLMDTVPEATNGFEALDLYCSKLFKRIRLKDKAQIDSSEDLSLFLHLKAYRKEIAELTNQQYIKGELK